MRNRRNACGRGRRLWAFFWIMAVLGGGAVAQEAPDADDEVEVEDSVADPETEVVTVTGTRLIGGDATARVEVITAEDIATQGLSTFEDVIRSIPQNFSTINNANSLDFGSDLLDANLGALGLGAATANLRGFGSKHTLVLVNGKRLAGVQSSAEQLAANLNDIPTAAIERVEIALDGGSAVYGSDAVAGVINVITRRDFKGLTVGGKVENSNTGGDARSAHVYAGTGWGSGSVTAIFSVTESDPISTRKTGWTTNDYSDLYGGDSNYDFRYVGYSRSGVVGLSRWGTGTMILPAGNDGRNAQPDDFITVSPADYLDVIPRDIGGSTETQSLTASALQSFGAREQLQLRADLLWRRNDMASQVSTFGSGGIQVPASNAFNNFGQDVYINYYPDTEVELGLLPHVEQTSQRELRQYVLSAAYLVSDRLRLEVDFSQSEATAEGDQFMFAGPSSRIDDAARFARLSELMASPDPSVAINLFGDGTGQNPTIAELYRSYASDRDDTFTRIVEPKLSGELWDLPGGAVGFVVGTEFRKDWIETPGDDFNTDYIGTARPTRELTAYFLEATVPLIGPGNSRPGLRGLVFSTQLRYDDYSAEGSVANDDQGEPILVKAQLSNTVYRVGAAWQPVDSLLVKASRSEAFKTPTISDVFGGQEREFESNFVYDPLATPPFVPAVYRYGPNPDLLPESSTNWTVGFDWQVPAAPGLVVKAAWSRIDLEDKISTSSQLRGLLPVDVYGNLPEFFVRDEEGNLLESISRPVNIAKRADERLDLELAYRIDTDFGMMRPRLIYSRVLDMFDQAVPGGGEFAFYGQSIGVDEYKLRGNVSLISGPITADLWVRHTPSYINNDHENAFTPLPNEPVGSHTTTDLTAAYQLDNGWLVRVGGRNIFDRDFPYMLSSSRSPYDRKRVQLRKRVLFLEVKYQRGQ